MGILETIDSLKRLSKLIEEQIKLTEKQLEVSMLLEHDKENNVLQDELDRIVKEKDQLNIVVQELQKKIYG